jgi:hypothetical protein
MGLRMVLGYRDGLTIRLKNHIQRQQAESLIHDAVATNFQFVEPPRVIPRAADIQRGPACFRLQAAWRCRSLGRTTDHIKRQQAESLLHDVATNFPFVDRATPGELRGVWSQSCEVLRVVMSP